MTGLPVWKNNTIPGAAAACFCFDYGENQYDTCVKVALNGNIVQSFQQNGRPRGQSVLLSGDACG